jgi:hypothetical protein
MSIVAEKMLSKTSFLRREIRVFHSTRKGMERTAMESSIRLGLPLLLLDPLTHQVRDDIPSTVGPEHTVLVMDMAGLRALSCIQFSVRKHV